MELFAAPELHRQPAAFPSVSSPPAAATARSPSTNVSPPMEDVVAALEHATLSARRLSSPAAAADASEAASALRSLQNAHRVIGSFLAQFDPGDEPMCDLTVAVEEAAEADASSDAGEAEGETRDLGVENKRRRKRVVPQSWPAGRVDEREVRPADPMERRRSAMDLVFQFHG